MTSSYGVDKLRLKFPGGESLLFKDLSLCFRKGEKVLMLGPSGCGKSTLLQVMAGIIPNSIEVPMKAESINVPESWAYVFQDPESQFCMPFVDEEIAFVLENLQVPQPEMKERIEQLLATVNLRLENLHTNIQHLSGGMKQRLAIASVLALDPEVLFLDEPTAMLDPEGTKQVWQTLKDVSKDKTVIIVEHKIDEVIDFVDRIILFNSNGQIIADGKKEDVFANNKAELISGGIWYPDVWNEYINSKQKSYQQEIHFNEQSDLLKLDDFKGYRGKEIKIAVSSTSVKPGEWITVIGENGAGKSTFLHALMQLIKTSGTYEFAEKVVSKRTKLTEEMSFVFQNPEYQFVTNTVYDEVAFTLRIDQVPEKVIKPRVEKILRQFQLTAFAENHPYQLSIGQKRRLSVATAIVKNQKVLLLDEPTFGQDAKNTFEILEHLQLLQENGTSIIMVTHDLHIVEHFATRVWQIEQGILTEDYEVRKRERPASLEGSELYVR
ncbi:ABC transporter [Lottiidibacillus patelloidae]|uniref:ABC transporter n=1 Tax=Lottiidibacillus patelloidae TaxID=2670334 RepID=A0A263BVU7_9BACI|nr:ATP-binding cassette domain-containing protein [Lottiidibacillus patelloidae]OZM57457.1 ABC transporter [Lottiidibacillus patelloidae]